MKVSLRLGCRQYLPSACNMQDLLGCKSCLSGTQGVKNPAKRFTGYLESLLIISFTLCISSSWVIFIIHMSLAVGRWVGKVDQEAKCKVSGTLKRSLAMAMWVEMVYADWEPSPAHPTAMGPGRVEILPLQIRLFPSQLLCWQNRWKNVQMLILTWYSSHDEDLCCAFCLHGGAQAIHFCICFKHPSFFEIFALLFFLTFQFWIRGEEINQTRIAKDAWHICIQSLFRPDSSEYLVNKVGFLLSSCAFILVFQPRLCINIHPAEASLMNCVYFQMRNLSQELISTMTSWKSAKQYNNGF